jgi:hypothetical protein
MSAAARRKLFEQRQPLAFGTTAETCSRFIRRMCGHQDWVILLEENTIVDGSGQRLRVARTSQAREVVKSYWPFGSRFFLFVEGYNPRIHFAASARNCTSTTGWAGSSHCAGEGNRPVHRPR